ncbi:MAG: hypothetical protein K2J67_01850, partial [Lachnospiraceae bacterium]|nr:hypothetical protein [Lachnospiraceae bacterium]
MQIKSKDRYGCGLSVWQRGLLESEAEVSDIVEWEGYVERITFRNEENGYTVMFLADSENGDEVCCVGIFSYISEGSYLQISGREVIHPNYGAQ